MANILDKIFADKKEELSGTRRQRPLPELKSRIDSLPPAIDAALALDRKQWDTSRVIAELKRRTPFKGELRADFDPVRIGKEYAGHGAAAISILTESTHFGGSLDFLIDVRARVDIPLLRKDFIFDEYQVFESRAFGADFFLLIATSLELNQLADLQALGHELGLPALVETHDERDMEKALRAGARIIGINNRDLTSGKTDLGISRRLLENGGFPPDAILVCESGINERAEIEEFEKRGGHAFLIGESLMRSADIPGKLKVLTGQERTADAR